MYNNSTLPCYNMSRCTNRGGPQMPEELAALLTLRTFLLPALSVVGFVSLAISLFGNILFTWIIMSNKRLRTMAQFFLVNVAVADTVYAALNIVGEASSLILSPKAMIGAFCKLYRPLIAVRFAAYGISVFCLASLSVERCVAICAPMSFHSHSALKNKLKLGLFVVLWLSAIALSAPLGMCIRVSKPHVICLAVILHAIPLAVTSVANLKIIISLCKARQPNLRSTAQRDTSGLLRLLVLLIVSFLICWSPYHAMFLYHTFHGLPTATEAQMKWGFALHAGNTLTYFNSALHCVLYFALCERFRGGLRSLLARCAPRAALFRAGHASFPTSRHEEQVVCRGITNISQC